MVPLLPERFFGSRVSVPEFEAQRAIRFPRLGEPEKLAEPDEVSPVVGDRVLGHLVRGKDEGRKKAHTPWPPGLVNPLHA
jgi:hypothetical protein